jgi:predicted transposase/invertase (TIGR01784 family)
MQLSNKFLGGAIGLAKRGRKKKTDLSGQGEFSILPLKSDIVFKMVFADKRNTDILRCFLSAALDIPEGQFEEISVIDSHLELESPDDKLGILDVRVLTESGKRIDIEIQLRSLDFMPERITFYTCKNLTTQIASGDSYGAIRKTITIVILDFPLLDSPSYQHKFDLYDERNRLRFTDVLEIYTLELPKLPEETSDENLLLHWLRLFKAQRLEEYEMLAVKNPTIGRTVDILKRLSADDKARLAYEAREKARRDELARLIQARNSGKAEGKIEGRIEGKEEGRTEGIMEGEQKARLEFAANLIAEGFAPEQIARMSGLALEEVRALLNS